MGHRWWSFQPRNWLQMQIWWMKQCRRPTSLLHLPNLYSPVFSLPFVSKMNVFFGIVTERTSFVKTMNYIIRRNAVKILALFEPKISRDQAQIVCQGINLSKWHCVEAQGFVIGIWLFWDDQCFELDIPNVQENFIGSKIRFKNQSFQLVTVYAPPSVHRRQRFWSTMNDDLLSIGDPFFAGGDFNCIMDQFERHGDSSVFRDPINDIGLLDMGFIGQNFTWSRGVSVDSCISKRLDRVLMNYSACIECPSASVRHLSKFASDHTPILLRLKLSAPWYKRQRPFRFEATWMSHPDFNIVLALNWEIDCHASVALAHLQPKLLEWNKHSFGNITERKNKLIDELEDAQLQSEMETMLHQEEILWLQKSRETWLKEGDKNTSFFHASTIIRRKRNKIEAIPNDNGDWVESKDGIKAITTSFFRNHYTLPLEDLNPISIPHGCFPIIHESIWNSITTPFRDEEILHALCQMGTLKAPGLDGYQPIFFQKC
ncbi:LOW QUALITY PROTEIN: hypothetical protein V2J09_006823 [Rumex salicifolius]